MFVSGPISPCGPGVWKQFFQAIHRGPMTPFITCVCVFQMVFYGFYHGKSPFFTTISGISSIIFFPTTLLSKYKATNNQKGYIFLLRVVVFFLGGGVGGRIPYGSYEFLVFFFILPQFLVNQYHHGPLDT